MSLWFVTSIFLFQFLKAKSPRTCAFWGKQARMCQYALFPMLYPVLPQGGGGTQLIDRTLGHDKVLLKAWLGLLFSQRADLPLCTALKTLNLNTFKTLNQDSRKRHFSWKSSFNTNEKALRAVRPIFLSSLFTQRPNNEILIDSRFHQVG